MNKYVHTFDNDKFNFWVKVEIFYAYDPPIRGARRCYKGGCFKTERYYEHGELTVESVLVLEMVGYGDTAYRRVRGPGFDAKEARLRHQFSTDQERELDAWVYDKIVNEIDEVDEWGYLAGQLVENAR